MKLNTFIAGLAATAALSAGNAKAQRRVDDKYQAPTPAATATVSRQPIDGVRSLAGSSYTTVDRPTKPRGDRDVIVPRKSPLNSGNQGAAYSALGILGSAVAALALMLRSKQSNN